MGRALVVDDEVDICALLTQQLRKLGFQTSYCLTVREGIELASADNFDIVFVDLNLTDGSGYDLITSIRQTDGTTKIVVISAYDSERQRALNSGANMFVPKPFTRKSIHDTLEKLKFVNS